MDEPLASELRAQRFTSCSLRCCHGSKTLSFEWFGTKKYVRRKRKIGRSLQSSLVFLYYWLVSFSFVLFHIFGLRQKEGRSDWCVTLLFLCFFSFFNTRVWDLRFSMTTVCVPLRFNFPSVKRKPSTQYVSTELGKDHHGVYIHLMFRLGYFFLWYLDGGDIWDIFLKATTGRERCSDVIFCAHCDAILMRVSQSFGGKTWDNFCSTRDWFWMFLTAKSG